MQVIGFWKRLCAYLIDCFLLSTVYSIFYLSLTGISTIPLVIDENTGTSVFFGMQMFIFVVIYILNACYYVFLQSSKLQGTIGKRLLGIKVVDESGGRISIGSSLLRFIAYSILSPIFYIGFIMVAFTKKKQGLHDLIAKTYVVNR